MAASLLLGIGNSLLSDDGAGLYALRVLQERYPDMPDVRCIDGGTLSFTLLEDIESADQLIVFDAARLGRAPGSVACLRDVEMDVYLRAGRGSVHEIGLADLLDMARLRQRLPGRRALIGIQPATLDWGARPSPVVARALPEAAALAIEVLHTWRTNAADHASTVAPPDRAGRATHGGQPS